MPAKSTTSSSHALQAPKGTRDFYPADMAVRRHIERLWREVSINHGFEEVDGPMFEHTELYTIKSGAGIVNEIFGVFSGKDAGELEQLRASGKAPYALRPEFTPTLARMVASKAAELPRPIKWFCIPNFFRAERPQRGRLREFSQWNVDMLGEDSPRADAEVIACAVRALESLGMRSADITIKLSDRQLIMELLSSAGVEPARLDHALTLLDRKDRTSAEQYADQASEIGLQLAEFDAKSAAAGELINACIAAIEQGRPMPGHGPVQGPGSESMDRLRQLARELAACGVLRWCEFDSTIVRGLAYYTGTVFEVHEASGQERAIAGGGRYDKLVELFGGPPLPAVGFAMGDVVLSLVLRDKGLLKPAEEYLPRPHVFVVSSGHRSDAADADAMVPRLVAELRGRGFHVRHSYKTTKNIGKLLGEAAKVRAHAAVILGRELDDPRKLVGFKDLDSGEQIELPIDELESRLRTLLAQRA